MLNLQAIHHNKEEWKEPEKFIPDRFDKGSEYFLTPSGSKRNPFSYAPFLGGKRVCLGKTFAELVAKAIIPAIFTKYEFEF
jgi:steroid 17alpha-monooxygenase/17alpha-hydroxyprogesterone aldolase